MAESLKSNTGQSKTRRFNGVADRATAGTTGIMQCQMVDLLREFVLHLNPTHEQITEFGARIEAFKNSRR